ncbi:DUF3995 domain-containing protein [Streptomyces roseolus]|uniref:DUF3995 domain-containing protein n=1 Tax=Streptomyces roseolus TaxID=67358 RepID=UPI00365DC914
MHFSCAPGGDVGLDVAAGPSATQRPLPFVTAGLRGAGGLCLLGSALAGLLTRCDLRSTPTALARWPGRCVGAVLLTRGNGLEVMPLTGIGPVDTAVGEEQRNRSPALWNPWFIAGGIAFGLAALRSGRQREAVGAQDRESGSRWQFPAARTLTATRAAGKRHRTGTHFT